MKFTTQEELNDYVRHIAFGGFKGFSVGMLASLGAAAILKRRTNVFHTPGGYHRVMIMVAPATFTSVVGADWATGDFEHLQRTKQHESKGIPSPSLLNSDSTNEMTRWEKFTSWLDGHKYRVIVGGWAASLAGSFAIVNRDIYLSRAQKLVQARVYAQGLTVIMLLASVIIKVSCSDIEKNTTEARDAATDSWKHGFAFVKAANTPVPSKRSE